MHDLTPLSALGGTSPQVDRFDHITIRENDDLALASVAARLGQEAACRAVLQTLLGAVPGPGSAQLSEPEWGFWMGPDQWMIAAPRMTHELLAEQLQTLLGDTASVTEQSGGWVVFDISGPAMPDICERLCAVPIRTMRAGEAQRSVIHQMGCFVIRLPAEGHIRILGPRASAQSLHHALLTAARSVGARGRS